MFLTTHAAAGILISQHVHNPLAVFSLSFASHFVLDFIPHGDENLYHDDDWKFRGKYKRVVLLNMIDVAALVSMVLVVVAKPNTPSGHLMLIGILGSVLPDFLSHFFPLIHERLSWLFLVRWMYGLTKPTGIRYFVRAQNWLHRVLHHEIIHKDISFLAGLSLQTGLIALFLIFSK